MMNIQYEKFLKVLPLLLIVIAVLFSYSNTLNVPFVFDDIDNIPNNKAIRAADLSLESLKTAALQSPASRRWLPNISFALNYYIDGLKVRGFHIANMAIHAFNGIILYLLFLKTLKLPGLQEKYSSYSREIALLAALIWVAHPLQTNAVTYIVQRMTSLSCLFYLTALLFFVQSYLLKNNFNNAHSANSVLWFGAGIIAAFFAFLSKENSVMLIVMTPAYALFFLPPHKFSKRTCYLVGGVALTIMVIMAWIFLGNDPLAVFTTGYEHRDFTLVERLLTESRVIFFYLSLLLLPLPARLNLTHDFEISHSLWLPPQTSFAILGILLLTILIPVLFKRERLLAFGILWFLGNLVIESTVIPLELIFEHRLYLPSAFLILSLVALIYRFFKEHKKVIRPALLLLIATLMTMTFQRNTTWASRFTLWSDVVKKSPSSARAYCNLGKALQERKDFNEAERLFHHAYKLNLDYGVASYFLGRLYAEQNRMDDAITFFHNALSKQIVNQFKVCNALGSTYKKKKDYSNAVLFYHIALELEPDNLETIINLGISYESSGRHQDALQVFENAAAKNLRSVDLYNNWGISAFSSGMLDKAIEYLQEAIKIDPEHPESHYNLGIAYGSKGLSSEARKEMALAIRLREKSNLRGVEQR